MIRPLVARWWRTLSLAALAALVLSLGSLLTQHLRHGWPFSLHHEMTPVDPPAGHDASAPTTTTGDGAVDPHAAHAVPSRVTVAVPRAQLDAIGVRLARVMMDDVGRPVRAVATVALDESRVSHVHTRVAGWIERLYVNTTGQRVVRGAPLAAIFSQELLASQNEFIALRQNLANPTTAMATQSLLAATRGRLSVLGMTAGEIAQVERTGRPMRNVTVVAPRSGVVLHRGIAVGTAVDPSTELLTVADLSTVWVLAEIPESKASAVAVGQAAELTFEAAGGAAVAARVAFVYPTLDEQTRTLRVRFEVPNAAGTLRPGMYGTATLAVSTRRALVVPRDAVVDTGASTHVFVVEGDGRFSPRAVTLGARVGERTEVREGLTEGESVVASGVFLIDSESRLRATSGTSAGGQSGHGGH
ncbi:MAG: efflux RND transporter periplasmic adaptor subunit [Myxococcaceae bacterium]|nr:MAG: efflux RND transporter periplasmic adaptor subunit [Myxococcaceae bacterium]